MKRKAEKRAAGKMAGEDLQNEDAEEALEKAERMRALVRIVPFISNIDPLLTSP